MTLLLAAVAAALVGRPAFNDVFPLMADWPPPEAAPTRSPHSSHDAPLATPSSIVVGKSVPGCSRPRVRVSDQLTLLERSTYDGSRPVRGSEDQTKLPRSKRQPSDVWSSRANEPLGVNRRRQSYASQAKKTAETSTQ